MEVHYINHLNTEHLKYEHLTFRHFFVWFSNGLINWIGRSKEYLTFFYHKTYIFVTFSIQTIWQPDRFGLFKYWTCLVFRWLLFFNVMASGGLYSVIYIIHACLDVIKEPLLFICDTSTRVISQSNGWLYSRTYYTNLHSQRVWM